MPYDLKDVRANSLAKGKEHRDKVLLWTYRWGWMTDESLQALMKVQRRPGSELCRRGVLQRVEPPRGHHAAYVINSASMTRALELYEEDTGGTVIPYQWPQTTVPFAALGEHQEAAQLIAINQLNRYPGGKLTVDRELRVGAKKALPDFCIEHPKRKEWHEVELTPKYAERLFFQLQERDKSRQAGDFTKLIFWCRTAGVGRSIQNALNRETCPEVFRRGDGKISMMPGGLRWNPKALRCVSEVVLIGEDRETARYLGDASGCQASLDDQVIMDL